MHSFVVKALVAYLTMALTDPPKTQNVKISFHQNVSEFISCLSQLATKVTSSYFILKSKYTYTIYHKSNIINITGIPGFDAIELAIKHLTTITGIPYDSTRLVKVDNTTASGQFLHKLDLASLYKCGHKVRYNPSLFPGAFLTLPNGITTILFKSGRYIIVGCKSSEHIQTSFDALSAILRK